MRREKKSSPTGSRSSTRRSRSRSRSPRSSPTATTGSRQTARVTRSSAARNAEYGTTGREASCTPVRADPQLLAWRAVEVMNRGWSIKQMHRLIMTSEAYRMASAFEDAADREKDPENRYLWRFRAQRLDAEAVRDSILAASGAINLTIGGPPVFPPLPKGLLTEASHGIWKGEEDG